VVSQKRNNVSKLVYYEMIENIEDAIAREKQLKGGSRTENRTDQEV